MAARGRSGKPCSPGTEGVAPRMMKMFDGRNIATRPIPVYHDSADERASISAAIQQKPVISAVTMPSGPRPGGVDAVFGTPVSAPGNVAKGAAFNPMTGTQNFE